jgi:hypothetical protein
MAGTITGTANRISSWFLNRNAAVVVTLTCTADSAAATYPATIINTLAGVSKYNLAGMYLYKVSAAPGGTAPTDATDLTITDVFGADLLGGKGTNLIDATTITETLVGPSGMYSPQLITGNITATISNNAVNSAVTTIVLTFVD